MPPPSMTERIQQQQTPERAVDVPHLSGATVDLPSPGPATRQRLLESIESLRVANPSDEPVHGEALTSLLDAIALRGNDQDLHAVLNLLDEGTLEHVQLHGGEDTAEFYAVDALLASGNPLALGMRPEIFERYQASRAQTGWPPLRTHVGIALVLLTLLATVPALLAYLAEAVSSGPFNPLLPMGGLSLVYLATAGPSLWQAYRRSQKAILALPWAAILIGALAPLWVAFATQGGDLLLPLAVSAGAATANALLIPKTRSPRKSRKSRRNRRRS